MIPKALYLTFLSWGQSNPPPPETQGPSGRRPVLGASIAPYEQTVFNNHGDTSAQVSFLPREEDVATESPIHTNEFTFTVSYLDKAIM